MTAPSDALKLTSEEGIVQFMGFHMDLDRILAVSDVHFVNEMGSGGFFAGFHITFQLQNEPLFLKLPYPPDQEKQVWVSHDGRESETDPRPSNVTWWEEWRVEGLEGEWVKPPSWVEDPEKPIKFIVDTQEQVNKLIRVWKQNKKRMRRAK